MKTNKKTETKQDQKKKKKKKKKNPKNFGRFKFERIMVFFKI